MLTDKQCQINTSRTTVTRTMWRLNQVTYNAAQLGPKLLQLKLTQSPNSTGSNYEEFQQAFLPIHDKSCDWGGA